MPCQPAEINTGQLLIGFNGTDTASMTTPRPLPDGTPYWGSPNIRLQGGINDGKARVDPNPALTPNHFIEVRVANRSNQAVQDVKIEVWVCDFTMGVTPSSSLASANPGGLPLEGFAAGPINPGNSFPITCGPWKPTAGDAALNGGHVCIAANCYLNDGSDGSPLSLRPAPFTNTFSFLCDTHHGQRNIAVVVQSANQGGMGFRMKLANPLPQGDFRGVIEIRRTLSKIAFVKATRAQFRSMPDITYRRAGVHDLAATGASLVMPKDIALARAVDHGRYLLQVDENKFTPLFFSRFRPDFAFEAEGVGVGQNLQVKLQEGQVNPLDVQLKFDAGEQPGAIHAFDLVQRDEAGTVVGGARLLVVLTA